MIVLRFNNFLTVGLEAFVGAEGDWWMRVEKYQSSAAHRANRSQTPIEAVTREMFATLIEDRMTCREPGKNAA